MKKILVALLLIAMLLLSGCNREIGLDLHQTFDRALIYMNNERRVVDVRTWRDYEGDVVQIIADDGTVYLTHYSNVLLMRTNGE